MRDLGLFYHTYVRILPFRINKKVDIGSTNKFKYFN